MDTTETDLSRLAAAWGSLVPPEQQAAFLALPKERRSTALKRIEVLQTLGKDPRPSASVQREAARQLGLSLPRLQALMRAWTSPSIAVAAPHGDRRPKRRSASLAVQIAERIAVKAVQRDRLVAEPTLHRRIAAVCSRLGHAPPARMTVRRILDEARRQHPIDFAALETASDPTRPAPRPGEILLLTTISFDASVILDTDRTRRASALLLVDAASGSLFAGDYRMGVTALAQTVAEAIRNLPPALAHSWRRPREIILAPPLPPGEWRNQLYAAASQINVAVDNELMRRARRWVAGLHWDGPAGLQPSSGLPDDDVDPKWPVLSDAEFWSLLEEAVEKHNILSGDALDRGAHIFDPAEETVAAACDLDLLLGKQQDHPNL